MPADWYPLPLIWTSSARLSKVPSLPASKGAVFVAVSKKKSPCFPSVAARNVVDGPVPFSL